MLENKIDLSNNTKSKFDKKYLHGNAMVTTVFRWSTELQYKQENQPGNCFSKDFSLQISMKKIYLKLMRTEFLAHQSAFHS